VAVAVNNHRLYHDAHPIVSPQVSGLGAATGETDKVRETSL
jgi:hypothetical protein